MPVQHARCQMHGRIAQGCERERVVGGTGHAVAGPERVPLLFGNPQTQGLFLRSNYNFPL